MERIVIFMGNKNNSRLLTEWLKDKYSVTDTDIGHEVDGQFDLGILDGFALNKLRDEVTERRKVEEPAFLPFLLVTSRRDAKLANRALWQTVDELILTPIEKTELQARLEILLRARRLSIGLRQRNEDLEALAQAMTHDLRAYMRVILGFTRALSEDQADRLNERGLHYLERIKKESQEAQKLVDVLNRFLRIGRDGVRMQPVDLYHLIDSCIQDLGEDIETQQAQVVIDGEIPEVQGDPVLLKMVIRNLLSNAIKYVDTGVRPEVTISADVLGSVYRTQIQDNGIGIAPEDQGRIFQPFVRLHGVEEYPGTGLGLSTVRKAVELMNGRIGVESEPGKGSTFWVELPRNDHGVSHH